MSCLQCIIPLFRKTAVVDEHCTQEALAFQHYYSSLQLAIQNPEALANILFAKKIIHSRVKEQIQVLTHTHSQKCDLLLNAVERQLVADPAKFYVLAQGPVYLSMGSDFGMAAVNLCSLSRTFTTGILSSISSIFCSLYCAVAGRYIQMRKSTMVVPVLMTHSGRLRPTA